MSGGESFLDRLDSLQALLRAAVEDAIPWATDDELYELQVLLRSLSERIQEALLRRL